MNQPSKQNYNTNFSQTSTEEDNSDIYVKSAPPLPRDRSKYRRYDEDDDWEDERRGRGCNPLAGCGIKSIACGGCFVIIAIIFGIVFVAVNKPAGIWNSVIEFLNAGINIPAYDGTTSEQAKNKINEQIKNVGENIVNIDENSFTAIVRSKVADLKDATVDIEDGVIKIFWKLDDSIKDEPLYGELEIKTQDKKLVITKVGVNRFGTPAFLNDFVSNTVLSLINQSNSRKDSDFGLLYNLLSPDDNVTITNVNLAKDKAVITLNINAKLF